MGASDSVDLYTSFAFKCSRHGFKVDAVGFAKCGRCLLTVVQGSVQFCALHCLCRCAHSRQCLGMLVWSTLWTVGGMGPRHFALSVTACEARVKQQCLSGQTGQLGGVQLLQVYGVQCSLVVQATPK